MMKIDEFELAFVVAVAILVVCAMVAVDLIKDHKTLAKCASQGELVIGTVRIKCEILKDTP
jgi:hypothetical protein